MNKLTLREKGRERRNKVYDLVKFLLKNKPEDKKVQDIYTDVAQEFNYSSWQSLALAYRQERARDLNPLPLFKEKKEGGRKNQYDKRKVD